MAVIYEHDENTPLGPGDVDGMAEFLDPQVDVSSFDWDPEVEDFPEYLNLGDAGKADRAAALHALLDDHGGPESLAAQMAGMSSDQRSNLVAGLARLGGVDPDHIEHHVIGDPSGAAAFLAQLDAHHAEHAPDATSEVHDDVLVAELKADLMEAILEDPSSPEVDDLIERLARHLDKARK